MVLTKIADRYVTSEISLEAGTYSLTEFIVTDENDVVISLTPQENSVLAQFASSPLPFTFDVSPDETKVSGTENINAAGYTSVDFGYTGLSLTFPENTDFFSLTVDDSELLTNKTLKLESITGSMYLVDWGDGIIEEYVSTIKDSGVENEISHSYSENGEFTINVSGPVEAIETLIFIGEIPDEIYQYQTNVVAVDLSKLTLLKDLNIYTGKLTGIDISTNTALENLYLSRNMLTSIDLTNNPNLREVFVGYNELTSIDVSPHLDLENLNVTANQLSDLDLSNNSKLRILNARENLLNAIDLTNNQDLTSLTLNLNAITELDITQHTKLLDFSARENQITSIDFSNNSELRSIDVYQNQIASINVSSNLNLNRLNIADNQLTNLNLSNNLLLESLSVKNNMLSELDLTSNPKIFSAHIATNQFSAIALDSTIAQIHSHVIENGTMNGFIDYQNNPGFDDIDSTTIVKLNELVNSYYWTLIDY